MSEEEIKEVFAKNLLYYLGTTDKTQADLSRYLSVSTATVSDWCNAKKLPRMDKIQSICNWLNIEKSDLLENKKNKTTSLSVLTDKGKIIIQLSAEKDEIKTENEILIENFNRLPAEARKLFLDFVKATAKDYLNKP